MAKQRFAVDGLAAAGVWVRRRRSSPSVTDEALSLAHVWDMWNLSATMSVDRYDVGYAEVSGPDLHPTWLYLVEIVGRRADSPVTLLATHPLGRVRPAEAVRMVALVQPPDFLIPGVLVETADGRRMLRLRTEAIGRE